MKKNKPEISSEPSLREIAEEELKKRQARKGNAGLNEADVLKLLHELQVHQVELEMLNEELIAARDIAESSAEKYIELYDFAPVGYFTLLPDGTISQLNLNCAKLLGSERALLVNRNFRQFTAFKSLDAFDAFMQHLFEDKEKVSCELQLRSDGDPIIVYLEGTLDKESVKGNINMFDITKRRQSEEKLKQSLVEQNRINSDLVQFAYVASHDLQEPLRMVANFTKLISDRYKNKLDSTADEYIQFIVDGARRMQTLISDLLKYSRVTTQEKTIENTDCNKIMEHVIADLSLQIKENDAEINVGRLPDLFVDKTQIRQLFQNLISNALKFRSEGKPVINISAELNNDEWVFRISDNGIGIDPEHNARIFQIFQRLHEREKYQGNGIGLAVCKKIVERNGGRIWVESVPGHGTDFYFTIPAKN